MGRFSGKLVLVTGGSSGIGLATAQLFAKEGARVIITGRDAERLKVAKATLPENTEAIVSDAGNINDIPGLMESIGNIGKLDAMVLNAGIVLSGSLLEVTSAQFDDTMNTNVKSVFFSIQAAVKQNLFAPNATVVTVTGIINKGGIAGFSNYGASKSALASFVRSLSIELIDLGIRFNAVCPGAVRTPIFEKMGLSEETMDAIRMDISSKAPIKRFAESEEIAKVILFLSCDDSSYIVGTEIDVDGGTSLRV